MFWWLIKLMFPHAEWGKLVLTFGDTIYASTPLNESQLIHEKIHLEQHHYSKMYAVYYIFRYFISPKFRLKSELEAYRAEVAFNPEWKEIYAANISSKLYGNLITHKEACELLEQ